MILLEYQDPWVIRIRQNILFGLLKSESVIKILQGIATIIINYLLMPSHEYLLLSFILVVWISLISSVNSAYSKVQFLTVYSEITSIINCKTSSNVIYTDTNYINYWIAYEKRPAVLLPVPSSSHRMSCSKYGSTLEHSYVVVLDGNETISLWEEVASSWTNAIESISFVPARKGPILDASIGNYLLALAYFNDHVVDIYDLQKNRVLIFRITFPEDIRAIQVDSLENLIAICQQNDTMKFTLHWKMRNRHELRLPFTAKPNQKITLDYELPQEGDTFLMRYLLSTSTHSGIIFLQQDSLLSSYFPINHHPQQKFCDHQLTYISDNPSQIDKIVDGPLFTLDQAINMYTCTTDTGVYVYSEIYAVSKSNGIFYIDCYYDVNAVLDFLIGFGTVCCCICIRLCPAFCSGNMCRDLGGCMGFLFFLFCWCPTRDSMDEIEDRLEK